MIGKCKNKFFTFNQKLNGLLGVTKDERNLYNLDQICVNYIGLLFFGLSINISLVMIVYRFYFFDDPDEYNVSGEWNAWLVFAGTNIMIYTSMGAMAIILCVQFYTINDDVVIKMCVFKDEKILKIRNNKIGQKLNQALWTLKMAK